MAKSQSTASLMPIRRRYNRSEDAFNGWRDLPFVYRPKRGHKGASNWHVPPTDDYVAACKVGREYAAHFAQFLRDNPELAGGFALGWIAADIDFEDESGAKGYWVGFFSHLERLIAATAARIDPFADADAVSAYYADVAARHPQ